MQHKRIYLLVLQFFYLEITKVMAATNKSKAISEAKTKSKNSNAKSAPKEVEYKVASELDFQMNASYLVLDPKGTPVETWPKENDNLAKQAVKYSGLVARGQVVVKKK